MENISTQLQDFSTTVWQFSNAAFLLAVLSTIVIHAMYDFGLRSKINRKILIDWLSAAIKMNYPAASSEVSPKDEIYFIVASDGVLNPQNCK